MECLGYSAWSDPVGLLSEYPMNNRLMGPIDIGEAIAVKADSLGKASHHIMIVGMNGTQGSPFDGFPTRTLDPENGDLAVIQPFFSVVSGTDSQCFDLAPIRAAIASGEFQVNEGMLQRIIAGYDLLVIIPEITASPFLN